MMQVGVAGCGAEPGTLTMIPDHGHGGVYQKIERNSWLGVVGTVGGLLALFTGFSILSGFEILYWLSVRWWEQRVQDKVRTDTNILSITFSLYSDTARHRSRTGLSIR
jgi:hypothetical protein